jgi:mono/diheme cytochrome c family protein
MIRGRMHRPSKVILTSLSVVAVAILTAACGTQQISVSRTQNVAYSGAVLFAQRCSGCHTLAYAATHGSAANPRSREAINGPNFNVRCERPITRVLYAIENGGFSGAYMPQNIVVGDQARAVAQFVSQYAGRQAPIQPGAVPCTRQSIGTLPPLGSTTPTATTATPTTATAGITPASTGAGAKKSGAKKK